MKLTDIEAAIIFHKNCEVTQSGIEFLERGLRAVITANNAKVLEKLEPAYQLQKIDIAYSVEQVAALIQERDALKAQLESCRTSLIDTCDDLIKQKNLKEQYRSELRATS